MKDIPLLMLTVSGSHLYGLNDKFSDIDVRGVCYDPIDALLGLEEFEQYVFNTSDSEFGKEVLLPEFNLESDDVQIYGLKKITKLMLANNPNIVEYLFAPNLCELPHHHPHIWDKITRNKDIFLSEKIRHTFAGYAYSQLSRIKNHKRWIDNPPDKPDPFNFGMVLTEKGGQKWTDSNAKNQYQSLAKDRESYEIWLRQRNPKRKILEEQYGYDTKHAMHLWRLVLEAQELLITGALTFPLKDDIREQLIFIKNGGYEYDTIVRVAEDAIESLRNIKSVLPHSPNVKKANELIMEIYKEYIREL